MKILVQHFLEGRTSTLSYVVSNEENNEALIIDPVWNYNSASAELSSESANEIITYCKHHSLNPVAIIETHIHADHISASQFIHHAFPGIPTVIGSRISEVQSYFHELYDLPYSIAIDGSQFDILAKDDEVLNLGDFKVKAINTPGHTPVCTSYLIDGNLFVGDAIFMPDGGTGRCDFPGGSAESLFHSITEKIYKLPDDTKIFVGHDYQPNGRDLKFETSVKEQKEKNIHIKSDTEIEVFLKFRKDRDANLSMPNLIYPSIQVNLNAGKIPLKDSQGKPYLKIPLSFKND